MKFNIIPGKETGEFNLEITTNNYHIHDLILEITALENKSINPELIKKRKELSRRITQQIDEIEKLKKLLTSSEDKVSSLLEKRQTELTNLRDDIEKASFITELNNGENVNSFDPVEIKLNETDYVKFLANYKKQYTKLPPALAQLENPDLDHGILFLNEENKAKQSIINRAIIMEKIEGYIKELEKFVERESAQYKVAVFEFLKVLVSDDDKAREQFLEQPYTLYSLDVFPEDINETKYKNNYLLVNNKLHYIDQNGKAFYRATIAEPAKLKEYLQQFNKEGVCTLTEEQVNNIVEINGGKIDRGLALTDKPDDAMRKYFRYFDNKPSFYQLVSQLKKDTNIASNKGVALNNAAILDTQRKLISSSQTKSSEFLDQLASDFANTIISAPPSKPLYSEHLRKENKPYSSRKKIKEEKIAQEKSEKREQHIKDVTRSMLPTEDELNSDENLAGINQEIAGAETEQQSEQDTELSNLQINLIKILKGQRKHQWDENKKELLQNKLEDKKAKEQSEKEALNKAKTTAEQYDETHELYTTVQDHLAIAKHNMNKALAERIQCEQELAVLMNSPDEITATFKRLENEKEAIEQELGLVPEIEDFVIIGDSLTDEWEMYDDPIGGPWSGIQGVSPHRSFTNSYSWSDLFHKDIAKEAILQAVKTQFPDLTQEQQLHQAKWIRKKFLTLDQDSTQFKLFDQLLSRIYAKGGLTAANKHGTVGDDFMHTIIRQILTNVETKTTIMMEDDKKLNVSLAQKRKRVIIEWSGANDLITINSHYKKYDIKAAVAAKIANLKRSILHGDRNFILPNLPELALVPRSRRLSESEQDAARKAVSLFNTLLESECRKLQAEHPECSINVFDIHSKHKAYMNDAKKSGFSSEYDFISSPTKTALAEKTSEANGDPKHFNANQLHYHLEANSATQKIVFNYLVKDACGQIRTNTITAEQLAEQALINQIRGRIESCLKTAGIEVKDSNSAYQNEEAITKHFNTKSLDAWQKEFGLEQPRVAEYEAGLREIKNGSKSIGEYKTILLQITTSSGDTIDNIYTPIKDSIAFERYQKKLIDEGFDMNELPTDDLVSYDDVHPSGKLYKLLYKNDLKTFINETFRVKPKEITIPQFVLDQLPSASTADKEKQPAKKSDEQSVKEAAENKIVREFVKQYTARCIKDRLSLFGDKGDSNLMRRVKKGEVLSLEDIFIHAAKDKFWNRTKSVLEELGWVDKAGTIASRFSEMLGYDEDDFTLTALKNKKKPVEEDGAINLLSFV